MKKYRGLIVGIVIGLSLMFSIQVFAEDGLTKIEAYLRPDLPIQLDGQRISLESSPVMVDGNTYLKLRDIAKLTGLGVTWNQDTQTVELSTYGNITSPVDSAISPTSTPITTPSSTTSALPSSSSSDTVVSNTSTGGSANMTSDGLPTTTYNGAEYVSAHDVGEKYYDKLYGFKFDTTKKEMYLVHFASAKDKSLDKIDFKSEAIPFVIVNGSTSFTIDTYNNVIIPLIK